MKENPPAGFCANRPPPRARAVVVLVAAAGAAGAPRADPKEKPPELVAGALCPITTVMRVT